MIIVWHIKFHVAQIDKKKTKKERKNLRGILILCPPQICQVWLKWWCLSMKINFSGSHLVWLDYRPRNSKSLKKIQLWWVFTVQTYLFGQLKFTIFRSLLPFDFPTVHLYSPDIFWPILNFISQKSQIHTHFGPAHLFIAALLLFFYNYRFSFFDF